MDHYLVQIFNVFSQVSSAPPSPPVGVHWTAWVTALTTPAIAGLALVIARTQARIARNKLKLDLYDRRVVVYDAAKRFLISTLTMQQEQYFAAQQDYLKGVAGARWLFDEEIQAYLDRDIWDLATRLFDNGLRRKVANDDFNGQSLNVELTELAGRMHQVLEDIDKVFHKYLHIEH
ncbi:hypothetical protein [Pseudomonas sp. DSP3-2-2]|uniref:hypothetical protein n=1 Tax=unclassified Pseudomonas TaxID=196821 RepID=UPI003CF4CF1F